MGSARNMGDTLTGDIGYSAEGAGDSSEARIRGMAKDVVWPAVAQNALFPTRLRA